MAKRIIVLNDGTWETVNTAEVWDITDEAYEKLLNGDEPKHLETGDVLDTQEIQ
jgi:hypothetical protein